MSRQGVSTTGGFIIRDRRRKKDEPFNPFAANANAVRQKKRSERTLQSGTTAPAPVRPTPQAGNMESDLLKKQQEARKKLTVSEKQASSQSKPTVGAEQVNTASGQPSAVKNQTRADRLAELRKQSQESIKKTESILEPSTPKFTPVPQPVIVPVSAIPAVKSESQIATVTVSEVETTSQTNVFKKITTKVKKPERFGRRRRRHDDGRGGRQPKVKKLNRQKYNEYKYAAKDILEDDSVAEEHRSNLLGQIWAKGERMGVEETYSFILDKEEQLIISKEVAERLTTLVRALTTRR
ncbi:hypothetical protein N9V76_03250 [Candidatus Poseidoniales archaeon]|nr:hypothetical protein [Candidatus Poseidoniales archaeon]